MHASGNTLAHLIDGRRTDGGYCFNSWERKDIMQHGEFDHRVAYGLLVIVSFRGCPINFVACHIVLIGGEISHSLFKESRRYAFITGSKVWQCRTRFRKHTHCAAGCLNDDLRVEQAEQGNLTSTVYGWFEMVKIGIGNTDRVCCVLKVARAD